MGKPESILLYDQREGVWKSWARDTYSFGVLTATAVATNTLMPPSGWINALVATIWVLWMINDPIASRVRMTPEQAREWLDKEFPEDTSDDH